MRPLARQLLALSLVLSPGAIATAGGFEVADNGPRALGRGGAYLLSVDEPSAVAYNPAALTRIDSFQLTFGVNATHYDFEFQRAPYTYHEPPIDNDRYLREIQFEPVENEGPIQPAPMIFAAHRFGLEHYTVGAALYGPSGYGMREYPSMGTEQPHPVQDTPTVTREGGQSYMLVGDFIPLVFPSLAIARELPAMNLSLGVTVQMAVFTPTFEVGLDANPGNPTVASPDNIAGYQATEDPSTFTVARLELLGLAPTAVLGVLWEPIPAIAVGATYRPGFTLENEGTIELDIPPGLESTNAGLTDDAVTLTAPMPDVVRLGLLYRHLQSGRELFNVEINGIYEGWHVLEELTVDIKGALQDDSLFPEGREIPLLHLGRHYVDTFAIRLGGDYRGWYHETTNTGVIVRAGGFYESAASPVEWTNVDFTSFERFSGSLGASYYLGAFSIDAAFAYVYSPERVVEDGEYHMLAPVWECDNPDRTEETAALCATNDGAVPTHAVNNGTYNVSYQILSLGFTYGW